jgi:isopentenyl-diphosphate delta-isomerase
VFIGVYRGGSKPDSKEVADYKWIEIEKLKESILKNPDKYTPWFKKI